jgi:hypothetical protein
LDQYFAKPQAADFSPLSPLHSPLLPVHKYPYGAAFFKEILGGLVGKRCVERFCSKFFLVKLIRAEARSGGGQIGGISPRLCDLCVKIVLQFIEEKTANHANFVTVKESPSPHRGPGQTVVSVEQQIFPSGPTSLN